MTYYYNNTLSHAEWKKHKYIRKEGNTYIYPEDLQKGNKEQNAAYWTNKSNQAKARQAAVTQKVAINSLRESEKTEAARRTAKQAATDTAKGRQLTDAQMATAKRNIETRQPDAREAYAIERGNYSNRPYYNNGRDNFSYRVGSDVARNAAKKEANRVVGTDEEEAARIRRAKIEDQQKATTSIGSVHPSYQNPAYRTANGGITDYGLTQAKRYIEKGLHQDSELRKSHEQLAEEERSRNQHIAADKAIDQLYKDATMSKAEKVLDKVVSYFTDQTVTVKSLYDPKYSHTETYTNEAGIKEDARKVASTVKSAVSKGEAFLSKIFKK